MDRGEPSLILLPVPSGRLRCAVIGSPVAHSLSPALHRAAYQHLGLTWTYDAIRVERDELARFVTGLDRSWRGLSVTMPLKRDLLAVATDLAAPVPDVGVANTLICEPSRRVAFNTDIPGMRAALAEAGVATVPTVTVLGGGSTAVAAVAAVQGWAVSVTACVRTPSRADPLVAVASTLGVPLSVAPWPDAARYLDAAVVVSTTPAGATDHLAGAVPADPGLLFDVVYRPWPTPLAAAWVDRGGRVLSGLDLLVHQAVGQVELMTGQSVPLDVLRAAAVAT